MRHYTLAISVACRNSDRQQYSHEHSTCTFLTQHAPCTWQLSNTHAHMGMAFWLDNKRANRCSNNIIMFILAIAYSQSSAHQSAFQLLLHHRILLINIVSFAIVQSPNEIHSMIFTAIKIPPFFYIWLKIQDDKQILLAWIFLCTKLQDNFYLVVMYNIMESHYNKLQGTIKTCSWEFALTKLSFLWKLDHIPSSCIVLMVHVVKVVNIVHATSMPAPQSQRWSLRPTLDLDRDKFRCCSHRRWTW